MCPPEWREGAIEGGICVDEVSASWVCIDVELEKGFNKMEQHLSLLCVLCGDHLCPLLFTSVDSSEVADKLASKQKEACEESLEVEKHHHH
ncbi:hypothetical protein AOLI_G00292470 [Acnodon oligacanthus]